MKRKLNQVPASLKNINYKAILRKRGIYTKQKEMAELKEALVPMAKSLQRTGKTKNVITKAVEPRKFVHVSNEEAITYWRKQIHYVEVTEAKFQKKIEQFIDKLVTGYLAHLDTEIGTTKAMVAKTKGYFDDNEEEIKASAQLDFTPLLVDQATLAGREAYKLIGTSGTYNPTDYKNVIRSNVDKFTGSMLNTDKEKLTNIISHGIESGQSISEIRGQIKSDFDTFSKSQAERITRTEVLRVSNQAALDAYSESGVVEAKQWLTAGAVDECEQYEGQIVYLGENFYGNTDEFADGDPPIHPNCRCVVLPIVENSHPGKSLFEDEGGYLSLGNDEDATQTFFRGEQPGEAPKSTRGTQMFGDAFYVDRTRAQAAYFGETIVKFPDINLPDSLIYKITTQDQFDDFTKEAIKYAVAQGSSLDTQKAIPAYIKHLGFKAAEVSENLDPLGGVAVVDPKLKKILSQMANAKAYEEAEYSALKKQVTELQAALEAEAKEKKDLEVYTKVIEKHLKIGDSDD